MPNAFSKVALVSDVSLGYGSPQIPSLATSLAEFTGGATTVYEPDQPERPPAACCDETVEVVRVGTARHPHSQAGRIEYVIKVAESLNRARPDLLVVFCTFCLPIVARLRYRPRKVIYCSIESIPAYGSFDVWMNRALRGLVDVVVFPEENRARLDAQRCGFDSVPVAVMYNVARGESPAPTPAHERLPAIYYGGALNREQTLADFFLRPEVGFAPFGLYGSVNGADKERLTAEIAAAGANVRYHGFLESKELARERRRYAYSVVMYTPEIEHLRYAAPNKFFESIADGIPPIVAPHPQCKAIVNRYRCGIVMRDWTFDAFREAVETAMTLFKTPAYDELVENCRRAVAAELNWPAQFAKLQPHLTMAA